MLGSLYLGQTYLGGSPDISGAKRFLRAAMRLLNGFRTIRQVEV